MQSDYKSFCIVVLLATSTMLCAGAADPVTPGVTNARIGKLQVLTSGYPRAYFFRSSEGNAARENTPYADWDAAFSRLMGIEGKVLDEEVPGRSTKNIEYFKQFKQNHLDQLLLLHYNGNSRDPRDTGGKFFAGHWLYFSGTTVLADLPAVEGESDIRVSDASLFQTSIGRMRDANEDIGLCAIGTNGKPDWSRSEQVQLLSIDKISNTIRVRRGCFDTKPLAFAAGKSYAAAHVHEGPWGKNSHLLWSYNYSTVCPRDGAGKSCSDLLVDDLGDRFLAGRALESFDGVEFDALSDIPRAADAHKRGVDCDADGKGDAGEHDGVNLYQRGVIDFIASLRKKLGSNRFILADGWDTRNQRAFGLLNGIEAEGWPSLFDSKVDDWSGGLNRQSFWVANSAEPKLNYINHKFNTGKSEHDAHIMKFDEVPWNIHRLVFAGAMFTDSAICYSLIPPNEPTELIGIWDELNCGTDHRLGWLGKPTGPAVHLATQDQNLIKDSVGSFADRFRSNVATATMSGSMLRVVGSHPEKIMHFRLKGIPVSGPDLFLSFDLSAEPLKGASPAVARIVHVGIDDSEKRFLGWANLNPFRFTCYFPDMKDVGQPHGTVDLTFTIEGTEPIKISKFSAYASPDRMFRSFEHGLVIANPAPHIQPFDLSVIAPGKKFRRLNASSLQDRETNNGKAVENEVKLGPKDALFLIEAK